VKSPRPRQRVILRFGNREHAVDPNGIPSSSIMAMEAPIFIVGAPRSGTTLLRSILNRHPRIAICGETHFHHYVYTRRRAFGDLRDLRNRRRLVDEYLALKRLRFVTDRAGLREKLLREGNTYREFFTCFVKYHTEALGKPRWGEKTPQHALFAETLCDWYPGGTLIHMIRDPRDVVASLQRVPFAANSVVQNAWSWSRHNLAAHRCKDRPQYLAVCYETLVTDPAREVARICERLGEEYLPSMLNPVENEFLPARVSWMALAHEPVTTSRLGAWRHDLTVAEVAQVEWAVGRHMETFGYQRAVAPASRLTIARGLSFAAYDSARRRLPRLPGALYYLFRPTRLAKEEFWMRSRKRQSEQLLPAARR
jgi:hypothetical protein